MIITVVQWKKHQGRRDLITPYWFKFCHRMMLSAGDLVIGREELIAWIYLLCICSEANRDTVHISESHHHIFGRQSWDQFVAACKKLNELKMIRAVFAPYERDLDAIRTESGRDLEPIRAPELEKSREEKKREPELPLGGDARVYDPEHESVTSASKKGLPKLALLWNLHADQCLARVRGCSPARTRTAANRWKENSSDDYWIEVIHRINASRFCLGQIEGKPWKADFDFFIRPDTHHKVLEGKYDDKGSVEPKRVNGYFIMEAERIRLEEEARKKEQANEA